MFVNVVERVGSKITDTSDSTIRRSLYIFGFRNTQRSQSCKARQLRLSAEARKAAHVEEVTVNCC